MRRAHVRNVIHQVVVATLNQCITSLMQVINAVALLEMELTELRTRL